MGRVRVVTDSAAYIPGRKIRQLGIRVLPHTIRWDHRSFRDQVNISRREFFRRLRTGHESLRILPPSVEDFRRTYAELGRETDAVLSVHVSGRLSDTCRIASQAAEVFLGRCQVVVVDSLTSSLGLGILVTAAAEAGAAGKPLEEVVQLMRGSTAFSSRRTWSIWSAPGALGGPSRFWGACWASSPF